MKRSLRASQSSEITKLKIVMLERGLDYKGLAKLATLNERVVANILSANDHNWPPRARINQVLGKKIFDKQNRRV